MATASQTSQVQLDMEGFTVGIIGMGDMGKMYARRLSAAGWRIKACDRQDKYDSLCEEFAENVRSCVTMSRVSLPVAQSYLASTAC